MTRGIIRGRHVLTEVRGADDWTILDDGAVLHEKGRIVETGSFADIRSRNPDCVVIGDGTQVVTPGFVNSHHHIGVTPLQRGARDLPLELWSGEQLGLRRVPAYLDTLYSAFEMLASGITTVQHIRVGRPNNGVSVELDTANDIIRAYSDIGMRVSYATGVRDQNHVHHHMSDSDFVAILPDTIKPAMLRYLSSFNVSIGDFFDLLSDLASQHARNDLVRIQLAPPNLHSMSDAMIERYADYSATKDLKMHIHLDETPYQREYARRRGGGSTIDYLEKFGFLTPRLTAGHGVWMSESDMEKARGAGIHICHNCGSNLRLKSGIAPLNSFEQHGLNIAIGIDEAGINDDRDMLAEMRLILNIHRVPGINSPSPTAGQVLRMATVGGAATTSFGSDIGALTVGRYADAVLFNWEQVCTPFISSDVPIVTALLQRAKTQDIDEVVVGGQVVHRNGEPTRVGRRAILDELRSTLTLPPTADEVEGRELSRSILPHMTHSYEGYIEPEMFRPFYRYNSR